MTQGRSMFGCAVLLVAALISVSLTASADVGRSGQVVFSTAEEALAALKDALKAEDADRMVELFGKPAENIFITGDSVADARALRRVAKRFEQRAELFPVESAKYENENWYLVRFGIEGWNMHIPLVNRGKGWSFASEYATDTNKRVRRAVNEVAVADTLLALVRAQEEYRQSDRDGDGVAEYAQRFMSNPGTQDGLYWPAGEGEQESPLDGVVGRALQDGYKITGKQTPYGSYYYKILTEQGGKTRGGKKEYLKDGNLTEGFAIVAYPLEWNAGGDATFLVAKDGQVWKRDLGSRTESLASSMTSMNLDPNWVRVDQHLGGANSRSNW